MKYARYYIFIIAIIICPSSIIKAEDNDYKKLQKEGVSDYKKGNYDKAHDKFQKAEKVKPDDLNAKFNKGDALYKSGKLDEAANNFLDVANNAKDNQLKSKAYHNLGNVHLQNKKYEESINAYKNSLKLNPNDQETKYNLEYARRMMAVEQNNKQKQQNKEKNEQEQDKKNQQNQPNKADDKNNKNNNQKKQNGNQDKQQDKQDDKKNGNENQNQNKAENKDKNKEDGKPQNRKSKINKEEANRILNALNKQELDLRKQKKTKVGEKVKIEKNW